MAKANKSIQEIVENRLKVPNGFFKWAKNDFLSMNGLISLGQLFLQTEKNSRKRLQNAYHLTAV